MDLVIKPRQAGKTEGILQLAQDNFSYIVCPTRQDVDRLWQRAKERDLNIPQPITWAEFVGHRYRGAGIRSFLIDDLDRCIQSMTTVEIKAASLNGRDMTNPERKTCPTCFGSGHRTRYPGPFGVIPERRMCWTCSGNGYVES